MDVVTAKQAESLRQRLKKANKNAIEAMWVQGEVLFMATYGRIKQLSGMVPLYRAWGYQYIHEFIDKEMGMSRRKAEQYRQIYAVFGVRLAGKWNRSLTLPYCKMRLLAQLGDRLTAANVNKWLKIGASVNCETLAHEVAAASQKGDVPEELVRMQRLGFGVQVAEKMRISDALAKIGQEFNTNRQGEQLDLLAQFYLNGGVVKKARHLKVA